jgi:uncharacterized protein YukE
MSFHVEPAAVAGLGTLVTRNASAASGYARYNTNSGPNELGEGLIINMCAGSLDRWQALAQQNSRKATDLLTGCGEQLKKAAQFYRTTDLKHAGQLDATYPSGRGNDKLRPDEVVSPESSSDFSDWEDASKDPRNPANDYAGPPWPTEAEAAGTGWDLKLEEKVDRITGAVSLARHLRDLLAKIVGIDLVDLVITLISGKWDLLMYQGACLEDLHPGFTRIRENVDRGRFAVQDRWEGNAAAAAEEWLLNYSRAAGEFATFGREAGWKIKNFGRGAYHQFVALDIAVDYLIDTLFDAALRTAAGPIGAGISILRGENPFEAFASVISAATKISTILDGLRALGHEIQSVAEIVAGNGEVAARDWPSNPGGYQHPAVS